MSIFDTRFRGRAEKGRALEKKGAQEKSEILCPHTLYAGSMM